MDWRNISNWLFDITRIIFTPHWANSVCNSGIVVVIKNCYYKGCYRLMSVNEVSLRHAATDLVTDGTKLVFVCCSQFWSSMHWFAFVITFVLASHCLKKTSVYVVLTSLQVAFRRAREHKTCGWAVCNAQAAFYGGKLAHALKRLSLNGIASGRWELQGAAGIRTLSSLATFFPTWRPEQKKRQVSFCTAICGFALA